MNSAVYQTRKIRKNPKFADENYIDNKPLQKIINKRIPKSSKKSQEKLIENASIASAEKQQEEGNFMKGGLLDIFLDAVTGVENNEKIIKAEIDKGSDLKQKIENEKRLNKDSNNMRKQTFDEEQILKKKIKKEVGEVSTTIKREGVLKEINILNKKQRRTTTLNNISNSDQKQNITIRVDKSKKKLLSDNSSFALMQKNRVVLNEEVKKRIEFPKLLQDIINLQILLQSKGEQESVLQSFLNTIDNSNKYGSNSQLNAFKPESSTNQQAQYNCRESKNNAIFEIPETLSMIKDLLTLNSLQQQESNSTLFQQEDQIKQLLYQQAIFQLQQKSLQPNQLFHAQQFTQSREQKKRNELYEIGSNFALRKLSEHFKLSKSNFQQEGEQSIDLQKNEENNDSHDKNTSLISSIKKEQNEEKQISKENGSIKPELIKQQSCIQKENEQTLLKQHSEELSQIQLDQQQIDDEILIKKSECQEEIKSISSGQNIDIDSIQFMKEEVKIQNFHPLR